jgi:hypothetical protein
VTSCARWHHAAIASQQTVQKCRSTKTCHCDKKNMWTITPRNIVSWYAFAVWHTAFWLVLRNENYSCLQVRKSSVAPVGHLNQYIAVSLRWVPNSSEGPVGHKITVEASSIQSNSKNIADGIRLPDYGKAQNTHQDNRSSSRDVDLDVPLLEVLNYDNLQLLAVAGTFRQYSAHNGCAGTRWITERCLFTFRAVATARLGALFIPTAEIQNTLNLTSTTTIHHYSVVCRNGKLYLPLPSLQKVSEPPICVSQNYLRSRASSVNIVFGHGLDDRLIEVRSLAEAKGFLL